MQDWIIVFLTFWSLLAVLFIAEAGYYAMRWIFRWIINLFRIERDGDPIEIHAEKPNGL